MGIGFDGNGAVARERARAPYAERCRGGRGASGGLRLRGLPRGRDTK